MLLPGKPTLRPGGLWANDKLAFGDSTLQANKGLDFVRRMYEKNTPRVTLPGAKDPSTHLMEYGGMDEGAGVMNPTVVRQPGEQSLTVLRDSPNQAWDYAKKTGELIKFKKEEQAKWMSENYKKIPGVLQGFAQGGPLPRPSQAARQDATAPRNMYRSTPSGPEANTGIRMLRKALPINAAMLIQDFAGSKTPLTEQDLSGKEINELRYAARNAITTAPLSMKNYAELSYSDYSPSGGTNDLANNLKNTSARMKTTIGGAMIQPQRPGNNTLLTDKFDFNNYNDENKEKRSFKLKSLLKREGAYEKIRYVAGRLGSVDGEGIPVKVNLGNLKRPRPGEFKSGGLLPAKLTMLGPDGKAQMELSGGNRIFSRANTRELVSRSLSAKTPAELKELGGRIKQMLDKQDRNKPEYVTE